MNIAEEHGTGIAAPASNLRTLIGFETVACLPAAAPDHRLRMSRLDPRSHVHDGARNPGAGFSVPNDELAERGMHVASGQYREAHRERTAISKEMVVVQVAILGRVADRLGRIEATLEALDPAFAGGADRLLQHVLDTERQNDVYRHSAFLQRFDKKQIASRRERPV